MIINKMNNKNPMPNQILAARLSANLTQNEAARIVYAHLKTWQKWEYGERKMHNAFWELFKIKTK